MSKTKVFIEVDEDAVEKLDKFIKWCYGVNITEKKEEWGYDVDAVDGIPKSLMHFAKPIAKSFGLYPFNQPKVSVSMDT